MNVHGHRNLTCGNSPASVASCANTDSVRPVTVIDALPRFVCVCRENKMHARKESAQNEFPVSGERRRGLQISLELTTATAQRVTFLYRHYPTKAARARS